MEEMTSNNNLMKILQKENEMLKKLTREKHPENETLVGLLLVLEMQRERINFLEEGISDYSYITLVRK
jgi:hypothetical protein